MRLGSSDPQQNRRHFGSLVMSSSLLVGLLASQFCAFGQANSQPYTLASGSQLTDDCPFCDRLPIVLPLNGTFTLSLVEQNPLVSRYELQNIAFQAGSNSGPHYAVSGKGLYQVGGEVAYLQDLFLDIEVNNSFQVTEALCVNSNRTVLAQWPKLQINVDQTNGTPAQVYRLVLVAVPTPTIRSAIADPRSGDFHLEWNATGDRYQLERATTAFGPFFPLTPISTNSSFTDVGVLTNSPQFFYRLLMY